MRTAGLVVALGAALFTTACRRAPVDRAAPPPAAPRAAPPPAVASEELAADEAAAEAFVAEAPESNPSSETVTIKLVADPSRKARVFWGRKDLGLAPLEVQRPRGSGPLDLVVVTPGALTLHTRVFTDRDDKLALRLVAESDAPSLLGYREEPPAEEAAKPMKPAGAPPRQVSTPVSTPPP